MRRERRKEEDHILLMNITFRKTSAHPFLDVDEVPKHASLSREKEK